MSKSATNPVIEANFKKLADTSKVLSEFKMPGFDMNALMEIQRKNVEAITAINQTVFESLQSLAQRQVELMQQGIQEAAKLMNTAMSAPTLQEKVGCHAEASKGVVEKCMANARDAAETLAKCNSQTMETVSHRMTDGLEELRGLMKPGIAA